MSHIVCKFGGSSLADAAQTHKALEIIRSSGGNRYLVNSAPGKRWSGDTKVTDLLLKWHKAATAGGTHEAAILSHEIEERFLEIKTGLGIALDLSGEFREIAGMLRETTSDFAASRGEYLMGKALAKALGWAFVDPAECIYLKQDGRYDPVLTRSSLLQALGRAGGGPAVIPGFYGRSADTGRIKTFPRGGSDISGAIVAACTGAAFYDNYTDRNGMRMADPTIVPGARRIDATSYQLARELGLRSVAEQFIFHPAATIPVEDANVPTRIRNTNNPADSGTLLTRDPPDDHNNHVVVGIAGRKECDLIEVMKRASDDDVGFMHDVLGVLRANRVPVRHIPSATDSFSVIVHSADIGDKRDTIRQEIAAKCEPDFLSISPHDISLLNVVGRGMKLKPGTLSRFSGALARECISIETADQGASEINITFGVAPKHYEAGMRALYAEALK